MVSCTIYYTHTYISKKTQPNQADQQKVPHMPLDYSPLNQPVSKADLAALKAIKTQQASKATKVIFFIVAGFIAVSFIGTIAISTLLFSTNNLSMLAILPAAGIFIAIIIIAIRKQAERRAKLYKFAVANGIQFLYAVTNPNYAGLIFDEGDSRQISDALLFKDGTEIGNYEYTTGSGKNRQTHVWGYVRIKLTRHLPNMVLDARKNNLFGSLTNLPDSFGRGQTLSLEGDFNNYFTLYAPKEYERDALYIFTPDVMAAVIDSGQAYDMEVIDDNFMLYSTSPFALDSEAQLKTLFSIVEKIGTELRDQSDYYADERVGDRAANMIAEPGRRLKTGANAGVIIGFIIMVMYFIFTTFS